MTTLLKKRRNSFKEYSSTEEHIHGKDTFERFGDDLCEVLISYLPFDDKFRLECVSKQFQRLIFNKVNSINVNHQRLSSLLRPFNYRKWINIEALETVLRKCPNIRRIFSAEDAFNEEEVFKTIIENCNQLHEIESDFQDLTDETIDRFCAKFGSNLKKMNFIPNNLMVRKMLRSCPNIERMGYDWISLEDFFDESILLISKLKSFSFYFFPEDIQRISTFVESNKNTLRALEMIVYDKTLTTFHTNALFKELSKLSSLTSLGIYYYVSTDASFVGFIGGLSDNCPKLSKIDFDLRINNSLDVLKVYKSFNKFKEMKTIILKNHSEDIPLIPIVSKSLKDCKNLLHLKISGNTFKATDEFFASIDTIFPKLLSLHLTNAQISGQGLNFLSKMPELRSISLISLILEPLITELDVFELIQNSLKIGSIYLVNAGFSCDFGERDVEMFKTIPDLTVEFLFDDNFVDNISGCEEINAISGGTSSDSDISF